MTIHIDITEAQQCFLELVLAESHGEATIIPKDTLPVAQIMPTHPLVWHGLSGWADLGVLWRWRIRINERLRLMIAKGERSYPRIRGSIPVCYDGTGRRVGIFCGRKKHDASTDGQRSHRG